LRAAMARPGAGALWQPVSLGRRSGHSTPPDSAERRKETMSSTWRAERAKIPYALARFIAEAFKPKE
jgi:hypothetical protein